MRYSCFAVMLLVIVLPMAGQVQTSDLAQAALQNDFSRFDALYQAAPDPQFAELHRFWSWSLSDPFGAFYGVEMHEGLAGVDAGYAAFIEPFKIVDARGNAFYPSAETRQFLARRAGVPKFVPSSALRAPSPRTRGEGQRLTVAPLPLAPRSVEARPIAPSVPTVKAEILPPIGDSGGGIFVLMAILLGIGTLTLMVQTPPERNSSSHAP